MAKICPECQYPNLDKAETCFKCGADISDVAMQEARARQRVEQARQEEQQEQIRIEQQQQNDISFLGNQRKAIDSINLCYHIVVIICICMIVLSSLSVLYYIMNMKTTNLDIDEKTVSSYLNSDTVYQQIVVEQQNTQVCIKNMEKRINDIQRTIDNISKFISIEVAIVVISINLLCIFIATGLKSYLCFKIVKSEV